MSARIAPVPDGAAPDRGERLAVLLDETSLTARLARVEAASRPVLPALEPLLPDGRLPKGVVVEVMDANLLLAVAAGPAAASDILWTAIIGWPDAGLAAARAYGLPWERTLLADTPGDHWAEIASVLADACDTIILLPAGSPAPRQLARLEQRLRITGATLLTPLPWPGTAELRLTVSGSAWSGLGDGYGALESRTVAARCVGRGRAARPREALLRLPDECGGVSAAVPVPAVARPGGVEAVAAVVAAG
ncbi:hypothetical protein F7Q99_38420 [Streptomyces kaniharaensis]|uniref:Uncharacterized protein n=1 Tax=Streptomyces kaniharaensis TaxID=212423 RepID=A0A6N7L2S5_9ACTN|nr:hypothetical protein [Streptomyces kaniharaensis]MQS17911.1 hypothetical protein [Streptomyces kaniharaensis]